LQKQNQQLDYAKLLEVYADHKVFLGLVYGFLSMLFATALHFSEFAHVQD